MVSRLRWLFLVMVVVLPVREAEGHPLDISLTTLQVLPSGLAATTYIHPYELALLAESRGYSLNKLALPELGRIVLEYFDRHFTVYSRRGPVTKQYLVFEAQELYQVLANGDYLNFQLAIEKEDFPVSFEVDLFIEFFNTQTNKLILLDASGRPFPGSREIYLTARRTRWSFDRNHPDFSTEFDDLTDSDQDGMTDRMEILYGTDPNNPDTDADGYSDMVEFSYGWNPLDPLPSSGQCPEAVSWDPRAVPSGQETAPAEKPAGSPPAASGQAGSGPAPLPPGEAPVVGAAARQENLMERHAVDDCRLTRSAFLEKVLARLTRTIQEGASLGSQISLLLSIFLLGFLHASMPGHGKGILLAYLVQERRKLRHALGFVAAFTATHLIDVIILAVGFRLFSTAYRSARVSQVLKFIGGIGLLLVAVYMIVSGIRQLRKSGALLPARQEKAKTTKSGSAILIGFLTGLAPCPFGWAILMVLLSLGKIALIPPIILVFGLGILSFLLIVTLAVIFLRVVVLDLFSRFARFSQLLSGLLLLIFGLFLFTPQVPTL